MKDNILNFKNEITKRLIDISNGRRFVWALRKISKSLRTSEKKPEPYKNFGKLKNFYKIKIFKKIQKRLVGKWTGSPSYKHQYYKQKK